MSSPPPTRWCSPAVRARRWSRSSIRGSWGARPRPAQPLPPRWPTAPGIWLSSSFGGWRHGARRRPGGAQGRGAPGCHALRELRLETEPAVLLEGAGAEGRNLGGPGRVLRLRRLFSREDDRRFRRHGRPQARYAARSRLGRFRRRRVRAAPRRTQPRARLRHRIRAPRDRALAWRERLPRTGRGR